MGANACRNSCVEAGNIPHSLSISYLSCDEVTQDASIYESAIQELPDNPENYSKKRGGLMDGEEDKENHDENIIRGDGRYRTL